MVDLSTSQSVSLKPAVSSRQSMAGVADVMDEEEETPKVPLVERTASQRKGPGEGLESLEGCHPLGYP